MDKETSPHQCRSELTSPSLGSGRAATMKPNEPKSCAAAACPASARNTRGRESKTRKGGREGGREKEKDERDRVESVVVGGGEGKKGLKSMWTTATPQPCFTSSCILFLSVLFLFTKL